jgi:hypothetical protein
MKGGALWRGLQEPLDIGIRNPSESTSMDSFAQFKGSPLGTFPPTISVAAGQKVLLEYRREYLRYRCLHHLIPYNWNSEGPATTGLRDMPATYQLRLVSSALQVADDPGYIIVQICLEGDVINSVHAGCGFPVKLWKAPFEILLIQQTDEVPESAFGFFLCPLCYSPQ